MSSKFPHLISACSLCVSSSLPACDGQIYLRFLDYEMANSNECKRNFVAVYDGGRCDSYHEIFNLCLLWIIRRLRGAIVLSSFLVGAFLCDHGLLTSLSFSHHARQPGRPPGSKTSQFIYGLNKCGIRVVLVLFKICTDLDFITCGHSQDNCFLYFQWC